MKKSLALGALLLVVSVGGCESVRDTGSRRGAMVTRTHLGQPIARRAVE